MNWYIVLWFGPSRKLQGEEKHNCVMLGLLHIGSTCPKSAEKLLKSLLLIIVHHYHT